MLVREKHIKSELHVYYLFRVTKQPTQLGQVLRVAQQIYISSQVVSKMHISW